MIKHIFSILLILVSVLFLSACGTKHVGIKDNQFEYYFSNAYSVDFEIVAKTDDSDEEELKDFEKLTHTKGFLPMPPLSGTPLYREKKNNFITMGMRARGYG